MKYVYDVPEKKKIRLIIDSDAKNEADDQFAIVQALLTPKFRVEGIIATHFENGLGGVDRKDYIGRTMEKSFEEIERIVSLMNLTGKVHICHGCKGPIKYKEKDVEGVNFIIERAQAEESILHVVSIGTLTNIAAAIEKNPSIIPKLHVIWIGGGTYPDGEDEFNLSVDVDAANVVFSSNIKLWQITKKGYFCMRIGFAELEKKIRPCGKLGEYLCQQMIELNYLIEDFEDWPLGENWVICDMAAVGVLIDDMRYDSMMIPAPLIGEDLRYIHDRGNRPIRVYEKIDARFIFEDFYAKLQLFTNKM